MPSDLISATYSRETGLYRPKGGCGDANPALIAMDVYRALVVLGGGEYESHYTQDTQGY
jgi:hypothetical protein